jgi:nucleoprotein TPR
LKEIGRRDDVNIPSDEELENVEPADNVEAVITNHLVLFRSIDGLQEQNQKLLKIVRELGQKMEDEEKDYKVAKLERQKQHSDGIIQAYVKERDALKAIIAHSNMDQSGGVVHSSAKLAVSNASSTLALELSDIQNQFDTYRTEMGADSVKLREENILAQREIGQLQAKHAKSNAQNENQTGEFNSIS